MLLLISFIIISCNTIANCDVSAGSIENNSNEANEKTALDNFNVSIKNIGGTWYLCTDYLYTQAENNALISGDGMLTFDSMKEFKEKLINVSFTESDLRNMQNFPRDEKGIIICDPNSLMEITNLPNRDGYKQTFVEWFGGNYYGIEYQSENQKGLGISIFDEEKLQKYMIQALEDVGNYEELSKNKNILNLKRTTEKTEMGEMEVFNYDTDGFKNQKRTYIEFIYNDIKYIISEKYSPEGMLSYSCIFVFNGDNSFAITNIGNNFSYKDIISLQLSYVK